MPIKFRCAYCNQLMAIARRKAGTVVRCPTCAGQVVVPNTESSPQQPPAPARDAPPPPGGVFERSDFDQVFQGPAAPGTQPAGFPLGPEPVPAPPGFDVEPVALTDVGGPRPGSLPRGMLLTPAKGIVLSLIVAAFVVLAFFVGLLVGKAD